MKNTEAFIKDISKTCLGTPFKFHNLTINDSQASDYHFNNKNLDFNENKPKPKLIIELEFDDETKPYHGVNCSFSIIKEKTYSIFNTFIYRNDSFKKINEIEKLFSNFLEEKDFSKFFGDTLGKKTIIKTYDYDDNLYQNNLFSFYKNTGYVLSNYDFNFLHLENRILEIQKKCNSNYKITHDTILALYNVKDILLGVENKNDLVYILNEIERLSAKDVTEFIELNYKL